MFYVVKSVKEVLSTRLFQSCPNPLFQSEAKCEGIEKEMTLFSSNKPHFRVKGFTLSPVLKVKRFGTRKWPVVRLVFYGEILT